MKLWLVGLLLLALTACYEENYAIVYTYSGEVYECYDHEIGEEFVHCYYGDLPDDGSKIAIDMDDVEKIETGQEALEVPDGGARFENQ